jgi:hypothetical protein
MMDRKTIVRAALIAFSSVFAFLPANAAIIHKSFVATLDTGAYSGTVFPGTFSYNNATVTGVGTEYVGLTSLNFTLKGVAFTRFDIDEGGQAVLEDGVFSYFTAAIFPPTPWPAPVSDIAFGFGGPGVIGYITGANDFGSGTYMIVSASVPEPATPAVMALGLLVLLGMRRRR